MKLIYNKMLLCCLLLAQPSVYAQTATTASGGTVVSSTGSISYSVGQAVYHAYSGGGKSVTEGVQQAREISVLTAIEVAQTSLSILAFPNPTSNYLQLKVEGEMLEHVAYELRDQNGKSIAQGALVNNEARVEMTDLAGGIYLVAVRQADSDLKIFKILKK